MDNGPERVFASIVCLCSGRGVCSLRHGVALAGTRGTVGLMMMPPPPVVGLPEVVVAVVVGDDGSLAAGDCRAAINADALVGLLLEPAATTAGSRRRCVGGVSMLSESISILFSDFGAAAGAGGWGGNRALSGVGVRGLRGRWSGGVEPLVDAVRTKVDGMLADSSGLVVGTVAAGTAVERRRSSSRMACSGVDDEQGDDGDGVGAVLAVRRSWCESTPSLCVSSSLMASMVPQTSALCSDADGCQSA